MKEPLLRAARSDDAVVVAEILLRTREATMPYAPSVHSAEEVHRWVREELLPTGSVTVACDGDLALGLVARRDAGDTCWIDQLFVLPDRLREGIGSRLLLHALEGVTLPVRLWCFQENERARAFYEAHGFRPLAFGDGSGNEEGCPDVLYERVTGARALKNNQ